MRSHARMARLIKHRKRCHSDRPAPRRRRRGARSAIDVFAPIDYQEERCATAGLAQIGRFVSMMFESREGFFAFTIEAQGLEFPVGLWRKRRDQTVAMLLFTCAAEREQAIRAFFDQQGIQALGDDQDRASPGAARALAYRLPLEPARVTRVVTQLLRSVYGLSDEAGLDFRYYGETTA